MSRTTPHPEPSRRIAPGMAGLLLCALLAPPAAAAPPPGPTAFGLAGGGSTSEAARLRWEPLPAFGAIGSASAVAVGPEGEVAVGSERGVWGWSGQGVARSLLQAGPVKDLVFDRQGRLLAATERGVYRRETDGSWRRSVPGPGAARRVHRLAVSSQGIVCGTEAGVFHSVDGNRWLALAGGPPPGPVTALAFGEASDGSRLLWLLREGALLRVGLELREGGYRALAVHREAWAEGPGTAVDLLPGSGPEALTLLALRSIGRRSAAGWRWSRPALPPGASARRLLRHADRLWLATDRGLLVAQQERGPWQRVDRPLGAASISSLVPHGAALLAVGARGVWRGAQPTPDERRQRRLRHVEEALPPVSAVQRAALHHLGLGPERMRALRRGVDRRGWLPTLELRWSLARGTTRSRDEDESFSSGALRLLVDRDRRREHDHEVGAVLRWDLGDAAFHPEAIDVSREAREVIELRDEVLDEITQLYFERRRVLLDWAAHPEPSSLEAERLRLRADELAAGLDAWTGGWWSHRASAPPARSHSSSPLRPGEHLP